jgi:ABC-2 type transport system ATP-binding protein
VTASVNALETRTLGKRYGRGWGLQDCTLTLPQGRIAALVGPNGAGKSTLLRMAAGITNPSTGDLSVLGCSPQEQRVEVLQRVGYLDQERPLYRSFRVEETLRIGRALNPNWDEVSARRYLGDLGIDLTKRVGKLSVGQQAQVALTMCLAKRPELLLLDEPVAALDPLARQELMQVLLDSTVARETTVLLSSHALADVELVCDYVIILSASRVLLADDLERILATHRLLVGTRRVIANPPPGATIISTSTTERQSNWLVRTETPVSDPTWEVIEPTLEEIVLAYLRERTAGVSRGRPGAMNAASHEDGEAERP